MDELNQLTSFENGLQAVKCIQELLAEGMFNGSRYHSTRLPLAYKFLDVLENDYNKLISEAKGKLDVQKTPTNKKRTTGHARGSSHPKANQP